MTDPDRAPLAAVFAGPAHPDVAALAVTLEARMRDAQLAADVAALDALISEDLLFTGPDGRLGTKAQDLAAHGSGAVRVREHHPEELRVRSVGTDALLTTLRAGLAVDVAGEHVAGTFRYTRVWAREADGAWRVVGGHVSPAPEADAPDGAPHGDAT